METQGRLRPVGVATCLLFALGIAAAAVVLPPDPGGTQAATSVTALSVDREPANVVSYNDDPHGSFVLQQADIASVETGLRDRDITWIRYESTYAAGRGAWSFAFAPPKGETLRVGTYSNAAHVDYRAGDQPGISVQGQMYCFEATGRFAIHEIEKTASGLDVFSATFRFKCSEKGRGYNPGWVYGEIRYNASEGFRAAGAEPVSVDFGTHALGADAGTANVTVASLGMLPVTFGDAAIVGQDETAFSVASDGCTGLTLGPGETCQVQVSASPHAARRLVARLTVGDDTYRGKRAVPLAVAGGTDPVWAFGWGELGTAARKYTWAETNALGVTGPATPRLQAVFVTPRVEGKWITDRHPRLAVFHTRKGVDGARWSSVKRISGTNYHGGRAALAASGPGVYVTWVGMKTFVDYKPKAPRVLFVRRNLSAGEKSEWKPNVRLTSKTGRVGYPAIAAADPHVYVVWVASGSGKLMLATSHDRGKTWTKSQIGRADSKSASGYWGAPSIAADGDDVIVSWWPRKDTTVKVRISNDAGATFESATVAGHATWQPGVAALNGRFGIILPHGEDLYVRLNEAGAWLSTQTVPRIKGAKPQPGAIVLRGKNGVAIAYPACTQDCGSSNKKPTKSSLKWRYSDDDGEHWSRAVTLAKSGGPGTGRSANDSPSMVWPPGGRRAVLFYGWTAGTNNFRVYSVQGESVDPASAGPATEPAAVDPMPAYPEHEQRPSRRSR